MFMRCWALSTSNSRWTKIICRSSSLPLRPGLYQLAFSNSSSICGWRRVLSALAGDIKWSSSWIGGLEPRDRYFATCDWRPLRRRSRWWRVSSSGVFIFKTPTELRRYCKVVRSLLRVVLRKTKDIVVSRNDFGEALSCISCSMLCRYLTDATRYNRCTTWSMSRNKSSIFSMGCHGSWLPGTGNSHPGHPGHPETLLSAKSAPWIFARTNRLRWPLSSTWII